MGFVHFSHDHPLILNVERKHDGEEVRHCNGCLKEIVPGPYYCCSTCDFFLHKLCAELPQEMQHPMHPQHPLTLLASRNCTCNVCQGNWKNFTYNCSRCDFDLDIICASLMERKIEHKSHKHPLILLRIPSVLYCYACGTEHNGIFYSCTTCGQFWIHENCASLPSTITHSDHHHPLSLAYSLPEDYLKFMYTCDICCKVFDKVCWFYYCKECRYVAHVNCATSKTEALLLPDRKIKNLTEDVYPRLPVSDESVSLINHFLKMDLGENKRSREINHFSHGHPLILFDVQNNEESCSESKPSLLNEMKNDNKCNGCMLPISAPFYSCSQCDFFLHKWCVELPTEVQHPCHPQHMLVLRPKSPTFFGLFECQFCEFYCNGFILSCASCEFYLDVDCASLPSVITHEAHAHHRLVSKQLVFDKRNALLKCNACHKLWRYHQFGFVCDTCDFKLHLECALLPRKTSHRYEERNPLTLTLTYSPVKDDSDECICEICEEELDPKKWFYHSGDCDYNQWFHARCIHPYPYRPKIMFGGTIKIANHPHPLTLSELTELTEDDSKCDSCGKYLLFSFPGVVVKCLQCNYKLHYDCIASRNEQSC